jgi:hypothetical protein
MKRAGSAARTVVNLLATVLILGATSGFVPARSQSVAAQTDAGRQVAGLLGDASGAERYRILHNLNATNRIASGLSVADLNAIIAGMEDQRAKVISLMARKLQPNLTAADVVVLSGDTSGSTRYNILHNLNAANRIASGLTVADLNAIIVGMEDQRAKVISLMARKLQPNLTAADVVALSGDTRGSTRYTILHNLNAANRIASGLTVADLNAIIVGMEDQRAKVISLMARKLQPNLSAADVVASGGSAESVPLIGTDPQPSDQSTTSAQSASGAGVPATNGSLGTLIERLIAAVPENPPYLYDVDTFSSAVSTVATDLIGSKGKRVLYDEYYFAAIEYRTMAQVQLNLARRAVRNSAEVTARDHVNQAMRLLDRRNSYATAASDVYVGNVDTTYARVEPVYKVSAVTARILARVDPTPLTSTIIDTVFTGTDYYVNRANLGADAAKEALIRDVAVMVLMQSPTQSLGGRSIAEVIQGDAARKIGSSGIYRILDEQLRNPAFQKQFMSVLAKSGAAGAELVAEHAFTDLLRAPSAADTNVFGGA